jgi:dinuclear metal center YbgI/SA1388 family protein
MFDVSSGKVHPQWNDQSPSRILMINRHQLHRSMDEIMQPELFRDVAPNGLQVEGKSEIRVLVSGVTASLELISAAIERGADALLVHHGIFWRGQDACVTGWKRRRIALLLAHDVNLYAYHLPLDAHPTLGNNAQLALRLGLNVDGRFGDQNMGFLGARNDGTSFANVQALERHVAAVLGRVPVRRIAWCTGGAQSMFEAAIAAGAEAFITGEISEPQAHYAKEAGVAFLACGHHATERFGAPAFGEHLAQRWGLRHEYVEIDNPA